MQFQPPTGQPKSDQPWQPMPQEQWQQPQYPPRPETYYPPPSQSLPPQVPQWQQPPPFQQQYAQVYQPQVIIQQPKKSRMGRILGIGCGSLIALIVLIAVIGTISSHGSTATTPDTQTTASTDQSTSSGQSTHKFGETITAGSWQVIVHSVKTTTDPGNQFDTLKAGHVFLVVDATLKNLDSSPQTASTLIQWSLHDSVGNAYDEEIGFGSGSTGPEGTIAPNQLSHGQFAYQVPSNIHQFTLQFQGSLGSADLVQWTVNV